MEVMDVDVDFGPSSSNVGNTNNNNNKRERNYDDHEEEDDDQAPRKKRHVDDQKNDDDDDHDHIPFESLSTEQQDAYRQFEAQLELRDQQGSCPMLVLLGQAGSGKSRWIQYVLQEKGNQVTPTAMTGLAASLLASTATPVHSACGLGILEENPISKIRRRPALCEQLRTMDILIVDEVSMTSAFTLDVLSLVLSTFGPRPGTLNGGVFLILIGDLFQLPPIPHKHTTAVLKERLEKWTNSSKVVRFKKEDKLSSSSYANDDYELVFESFHWRAHPPTIIEFHKNHRQNILDKPNPFSVLLGKIRIGTHTASDLELLKPCFTGDLPQVCIQTGIVPTILYPLKRDVKAMNDECLALLDPSEPRVDFQSETDYLCKKPTAAQIKKVEPLLEDFYKQTNVQKCITLCVGAQVILISNIDVKKGLYNGARGIVRTLRPKGAVVEFLDGQSHFIGRRSYDIVASTTVMVKDKPTCHRDVVAHVRQLPVMHAWSLNLHRAQGMTIPAAIISLERCFGPHMVYMALSRAPGLESLKITGFDPAKIRIHPRVKAFAQRYLDTHIK